MRRSETPHVEREVEKGNSNNYDIYLHLAGTWRLVCYVGSSGSRCRHQIQNLRASSDFIIVEKYILIEV